MSRYSGKSNKEDARSKVVTEHIAHGKELTAIAAETGYTVRQLSRYKKEHMTAIVKTTELSQAEIRNKHRRKITELNAEIESYRQDGKPLPLPCIDRVIALLALEMKYDEPTRSLNTNVTVNPEHSQDYLFFREACAGLTEDQLYEVYGMAKALPRTWTAPPIEADFPVRMLPEATDDFS